VLSCHLAELGAAGLGQTSNRTRLPPACAPACGLPPLIAISDQCSAKGLVVNARHDHESLFGIRCEAHSIALRAVRHRIFTDGAAPGEHVLIPRWATRGSEGLGRRP
jgi:hypothetical protein